MDRQHHDEVLPRRRHPHRHAPGSTLYWLLGDHLGSTSKVYASSGIIQQSEERSMPWGENRHTAGSLPTKRKFTGQIEGSSIGLYFYA